MPGKHQKGDVAVPTFHASGTGRDLYLNPLVGQTPDAMDSLKAALQRPLQYTDIETGEAGPERAQRAAGGRAPGGGDAAGQGWCRVSLSDAVPCMRCAALLPRQATSARFAGGHGCQRAASTNIG